MEQPLVLEERRGQTSILRLNRPEMMNSLSFPLLLAIKEKVEALQWDADARVIIITGAGEKAFSAGADLKERATMPEEKVRQYIITLRNLYTFIDYMNKPVIGAVNGVALGGGAELAMACDIRIASENASIGLIETRLAIIPGGGGTQRLPRIVGRSKAKEMIFTGKRVDANEALSIGLVNKVVPLPNLMDECVKMAELICEGGPVAITQAKYAINYGLEVDLHSGMAIESNAYWVTIPTEDRTEALAAFKEKRKPVFKGK
jgi:enoyl-CoA hydratase/carnithine racemase